MEGVYRARMEGDDQATAMIEAREAPKFCRIQVQLTFAFTAVTFALIMLHASRQRPLDAKSFDPESYRVIQSCRICMLLRLIPPTRIVK